MEKKTGAKTRGAISGFKKSIKIYWMKRENRTRRGKKANWKQWPKKKKATTSTPSF